MPLRTLFELRPVMFTLYTVWTNLPRQISRLSLSIVNNALSLSLFDFCIDYSMLFGAEQPLKSAKFIGI